MSMQLRNYIRPDCFIADLAETSRDAALRRIVHEAAGRGLVKDENSVFAKLMQRENVQSTAVGNGIAIPHCFTSETPDLIIIVARSPRGLEFNSFDGKPTQIIFLLIGNRQEQQLKALAQIAWLIKSQAFIGKLICATSAQDMARAFDEEGATASSA